MVIKVGTGTVSYVKVMAILPDSVAGQCCRTVLPDSVVAKLQQSIVISESQ